MQERHNSIANALELCLPCTKPSKRNIIPDGFPSQRASNAEYIFIAWHWSSVGLLSIANLLDSWMWFPLNISHFCWQSEHVAAVYHLHIFLSIPHPSLVDSVTVSLHSRQLPIIRTVQGNSGEKHQSSEPTMHYNFSKIQWTFYHTPIYI